MSIKDKIRIIDDFPKEGISFKDISTLLQDGEAFKYTVEKISDYLKDKNIDAVVGPEARGFIIGAPVASNLGVGFIPVRKKGKLPAETIQIQYELEYGNDIIEIHKDAIKPKQRIAIIDDLLATGGTTSAVAELVELAGGEVVSLDFIVELTELNGKAKLDKYDLFSLVQYDR